MAFSAVINKAGFERGLDTRNFAFVDIRFFLFSGRELDRKVEEFLAVNQCYAQFFLLRRVD